MKKADKATRVLAKLVEVGHWIASVGLIVVLIFSFFMETDIARIIAAGDQGMKFSVYELDFTLIPIGANGAIDFAALRLTFVTGAIMMALMAMVFRNIYLIMKNSENGTPFQKDNVRMVREIGIFLMAQPILSLIFNGILRLMVDPDIVESSVGLGSFVIGMVVLCLSQFFAHGAELENDTEGLL